MLLTPTWHTGLYFISLSFLFASFTLCDSEQNFWNYTDFVKLFRFFSMMCCVFILFQSSESLNLELQF